MKEMQALELGVHRAPLKNGSAIPQYFDRESDGAIRALAHQIAEVGGVLLIVGDSTAGKTRSAYEAARLAMPEHRVFAPDRPESIARAMPTLMTMSEPCLLWLDEVDRFLREDSLNGGIVRQLSRRGIALVATVRSERWRRLNNYALGEEQEESPAHANGGIGFLNGAEPIVLSRLWSGREIESATHVDDERIREALNHGDVFGIAEYLAAGPSLLHELEVAQEGGGNPRGAAVVHAAIDLTRAGLEGQITLEMLQRGHADYLVAAGGERLYPEPLEEAIAWATKRRFGVTGFLVPEPEGSRFRTFDYLVDHAERTEDNTLPPVIWTIAQEVATALPMLKLRLAFSAQAHHREDIAEACLVELADSGEVPVARMLLARLFRRLGRTDEAIEQFQAAFSNGEVEAAVQLGLMAAQSGQVEVSEAWFTKAADMDNHHGMAHLAFHLQKQGEIERAEDLFRRASDLDEAVVGLGMLLQESGRVGEAESWLRTRLNEGVDAAVLPLGAILADTGRRSDAVTLWEGAARRSVEGAAYNLGVLYSREGDHRGAERCFRSSVALGESDAEGPLGVSLARLGKYKEAERHLRAAIDEGGDEVAMRNLAQVFLETKELEKSIAWSKRAIEHGSVEAGLVLGDAFFQSGSQAEAVEALVVSLEAGVLEAGYRLGLHYKEQGDLVQAERFFLRAVSDELPESACELAQIADLTGNEAEEERWLRLSAAGGHGHAYCRLGSLLAMRGDLDAAEAAWVSAVESGHADSAGRLAQMLRGMPGRGGDAAQWLRRAEGMGNGKGPNRNRRKRRSKKRR